MGSRLKKHHVWFFLNHASLYVTENTVQYVAIWSHTESSVHCFVWNSMAFKHLSNYQIQTNIYTGIGDICITRSVTLVCAQQAEEWY